MKRAREDRKEEPQAYPPQRPTSSGEPVTLVDVFKSAATNHKRPDALNYKRDGKWIAISSDELLTRMRSLAAGLYSIGVRPGDRVAILSNSRVEWTLIDGACIFAGAIDVPIYPTLPPPQVAYILKDSGANTLVLENASMLSTLDAVLTECDAVRNIVLIEGERADEKKCSSRIDQIERAGQQLEQSDPNLITNLSRQTTANDLATIIYTSGTTGEPKGVMLSHGNLVSNLIDSSFHLDFGEHDSALSVLPLSHVFERQAMYMYLYRGMAVYFAESLTTIGPNLREVKPTVLVGVPRIFEKIYARIRDHANEKGKLSVNILAWAVSVAREYAKYTVAHQAVPALLKIQHRLASRIVFSKWRAAFGGRIRVLVSGGAALPEDLGYIFKGAGLPIIQGYGLTETAPVITTASLTDNRIGTVGRPIPHVEVRIAEDGEIETRGPNVMQGYYNKPEETRAVFTEDGWFKTGDIGSIDPEGFIRITDRKKELFKTSGGKYIAPQPIEEAIKGSRFVNQVVLIGNGRKFPAALIVPDWEQVESYAKLKGIQVSDQSALCVHPRIINLFERQIEKLTPNLARYEKVKAIALIEKEFSIEGGELTPTLKVKRRVIDEKYQAVIDRIYESAEETKPTREPTSSNRLV